MIAKNEKETKKIGEDIAKKLAGGDIVLLYGELGAGKTTLTKGIANFFKIKNDITSPTFTLMNMYDVTDNEIKKLVHIDTYRLENENELIEIGIEDYLADKDTVCIIEWPEKISALLKDKKVQRVYMKNIDENTREIEIK